jgi:tellurite resistance protein TerA
MPIDYTKRPGSGGGSDPSGGSASTPPPAASGSPISLTKVTLTKSSPTVSLTKQGSATGKLHVNLNWDARPGGAEQPKGFLKRMAAASSGAIDLDLGCLFEMADGRKGVIQALGRQFGSLDSPPYIFLDGDDRSGANANGENLYVNLSHSRELKRILVFACIYEGASAFDQANGVVTLTPAQGAPIEVRLDETAGKSRMCAIALIDNSGGDLTVRREVRYIDGAQDVLDRTYGWGMDWTPGRK